MPVFQTQRMQKNKLLLAIADFVLFSSAIGFVSGQVDEAPEEPVNVLAYLVAFSTFIVSGVFYSASGWIKKIRKKLAGDNVPLDYHKMGKTVAIGVILGIGAFIYSTWDGDTIAISTAQEFLIQVGINTSVILLVDKWILGRAKELTDPEESDEVAPDDVPDVIPPGKGAA